MDDHEMIRLTAENTALLNEITRLRQSLREARELIEDLITGRKAHTHWVPGRLMQVPNVTLDAARKWLEENGDAHP